MKNWRNKKVVLVNKSNLQEVKKGDKIVSFRGEKTTVKSLQPPHKPSANGRVNGFYASVFDCEFIEVED